MRSSEENIKKKIHNMVFSNIQKKKKNTNEKKREASNIDRSVIQLFIAREHRTAFIMFYVLSVCGHNYTLTATNVLALIAKCDRCIVV